MRLEGWKDFARIGKDPVLRAEFDDIIESIGRGDGVPEKYYRAGIDDDKDALLKERGAMHLNLGGKHSNTLVFLVQYGDLVLLLESNSHVHFNSQPKGKNISVVVQSWFLYLERGIADAEDAAKQAAGDAERAIAEEHRSKLAASLAKLRREAARKG